MPITLLGTIGGFVIVMVSMILEGGNPAALIAAPGPLILVFGTTPVIAMAGQSMSDVGGIIKATMRALLPSKQPDAVATVETLVAFADTARREGLLALEDKAKNVEDTFLRRGLQLVIDGSDPESVQDTMLMEVDKLKERHKVAQKFFTDMGGYAPTVGIIGTVLGLVHVLENLSDPEKLGPLIAAAFLATLWGVMTANVFYLPISNKLKRMTAMEVAYKELVVQGVLSIQAGASPRSLGDQLRTHLAPALREPAGGKEKKAA